MGSYLSTGSVVLLIYPVDNSSSQNLRRIQAQYCEEKTTLASVPPCHTTAGTRSRKAWNSAYSVPGESSWESALGWSSARAALLSLVLVAGPPAMTGSAPPGAATNLWYPRAQPRSVSPAQCGARQVPHGPEGPDRDRDWGEVLLTSPAEQSPCHLSQGHPALH